MNNSISTILSSIKDDGSEIVRNYTNTAKKEFELKVESSGLSNEDKNLFKERFEEQLAKTRSNYEDTVNGLNKLTSIADNSLIDIE